MQEEEPAFKQLVKNLNLDTDHTIIESLMLLFDKETNHFKREDAVKYLLNNRELEDTYTASLYTASRILKLKTKKESKDLYDFALFFIWLGKQGKITQRILDG